MSNSKFNNAEFLQLLNMERDPKQKLSDEEKTKYKAYCIILNDYIFWERRDDIKNLCKKFLNFEISAETFVESFDTFYESTQAIFGDLLRDQKKLELIDLSTDYLESVGPSPFFDSFFVPDHGYLV